MSGPNKSRGQVVIQAADLAIQQDLRDVLEQSGYSVSIEPVDDVAFPGSDALAHISTVISPDGKGGVSITPESERGGLFVTWPVLKDRMQSWLEDGGAGAGFFLLNLDHFKRVRAFLGDATAVKILREVAARLAYTVRDHVAEGGNTEGADKVLLSHLTGDEFAIAVNGLCDRVAAASLARALLLAISQPYDGVAPQVYLTARIGIALAPDDGAGPDELFRNVASIVHNEQRSGRNSYRFYAAGMATSAEKRFELEGALSQATVGEEIEIYYQPQADLKDGRIHGAEALVRWRHEGTMLPADIFIATAEDIGLITEIGNRVLLGACHEARRLQDLGFRDMVVSINISPYQFRRLGIVEVVQNALATSGLDPASLVLEVTESLMLSDVERTVGIFGTLRDMGIHLALDDFGTGYSSLSYLKSLTIDRLKLDRSFVKGLPDSPGDCAVTEGIVRMARALDLEVTAEGVETEAQRDFLKGLGCNHYQGFLLSKPLPPREFERFLAKQSLLPHASS